MKNYSLFIAAVSLLAVTATAQTKSKKEINMIPLIDRAIFFDNPEIAGGQLSPDGKFISFLKAYNGILNIWVKKFDEPFGSARRLTNLERPSSGYFWTMDGKYIVYAKDNGGNENYNIYAVSPSAMADASTGIPESRNLTPFDSARAMIYMVSKKDPDIMMIGLNNRDAKWHDLYKLEISSGKLTLINENKDRIGGWVFDWNETPRMAIRNPEDGSTEFLRVKDNNFKKIYEVSPLESAGPLAFTKDNAKVYVETNKGKNVNLSKLVLMDPETGATTEVEQDPLKRVDLQSAFFSDVTHQLVYTYYFDDKPRLYFRDKDFEKDYHFLKSKFPGAEIGISSMTANERKMLFSTSGDTKVATVYFFDRDNRKIIEQYVPRPKMKPFEKYFSAMKPIRYKSSDGLEIPAYLTLPKEQAAKKLALLVIPHGGPWARDFWGFNSMAQLFANRGFAVLSPNFRGSTGYGKKFLDAGNLQWGKKMQDDITWGVKYLISQGIADSSRVAIMGGSYGGYATLAGLAFTPDVYAAGVDIVGPSNLFTLLSTIPPYWEAGRKIFTLRMGDESTEEGKKLLREASPLFSANKIKAPLMIIQGANDPRVKKAESDQIVVALRDLKLPVEYILAEDEGHGFAKPVNNLAMFAAAEKFLAQHVGTRYQEGMTDEVANRLKAMTVDVGSVKLVSKPSIKAAASLPALTPDLKNGNYRYSSHISVAGQEINMDMNRTVQAVGDTWEISDAATSPMGTMLDKMVLNKPGLGFLSREVEQGPVKINMKKDGKAVLVSAMGKEHQVEMENALIQDGAGMDMIIARLPLTDNYKTSFYTLDAMTMKPKQLIMKVLGDEEVNGVNCRKVEVSGADNPADKTTFWIDPEKKMAVKTVQIIPALNNAIMTVELK